MAKKLEGRNILQEETNAKKGRVETFVTFELQNYPKRFVVNMYIYKSALPVTVLATGSTVGIFSVL